MVVESTDLKHNGNAVGRLTRYVSDEFTTIKATVTLIWAQATMRVRLKAMGFEEDSEEENTYWYPKKEPIDG